MRFILICTLLVLLGCAEKADRTKIIWVRHAEKDTTEASGDPKLTIQGEQRARKLRAFLDTFQLASIYSTPKNRCLQTVMPTAADRGMDIQYYARDNWSSFLDTLPESYANRATLICGHRDQLYKMIEYMGLEVQREPLTAKEYDKIFILSGVDSNPRLEVINY